MLEVRLLRSKSEALILHDPMFPDDPFALMQAGLARVSYLGEHGKIKTMLDKCPKAFKAGRGGGNA